MRAISIKMGLWMLMGFVSFFLVAFLLGLGQRSELRVFNYECSENIRLK